jgi:hypothetical protein
LIAACGGDAGTPDAASFDAGAGVDSRIAACTADHAERLDRDNDPAAGGQLEATGLEIAAGGETRTICGELAAAATADADYYLIELTGEDAVPLRIELRAPGADGPLRVQLWNVRTTGGLGFAGEGRLRRGVASLVAGALPPGVYAVSVTATEPPASPIAYSLAVLERTDSCAPTSGDATWVEERDGTSGRRNDVIGVTFVPRAEFALTDSDADAPEPSGITLAAGASSSIRGESRDVASTGDAYLDRDTFELVTAAETNELEIRLSWPHEGGSPDLDLFLFAAEDPDDELTGGLGSLAEQTFDEIVTLTVDPGARYWLWIGAFDGAGAQPSAAYEVTLCGRTLAP